MVSEIRIYIEGGGDGSHRKRIMREGFGKFLEQLRNHASEQRIRWNITLCGHRNAAFDNFLTALQSNPEAFNVLLVDSEGPVRQGDGPWAHLFSLENSWRERNPGVDDEHCHLMVQMMEAWFIADVDALRRFYRQGFNESAISRTRNVEEIDKSRLQMECPTMVKSLRPLATWKKLIEPGWSLH